MKPNAINYLSLARKAGRIEVGEEPTGAAARAVHARLVILASDAPDNTRRRARNFVAGTGQQLVTVPFSKEELGAALGKGVVAMAAITDPALALAFLQALEDDSRYGEAIRELTTKTERVRRRQQEEKAHQRNLREGKKKHQPPASTPAADGKDGAKPACQRREKTAATERATVNRPAGRKPGKKLGGAKS